MKTQEELEKEYAEIELLENEIAAAPGWNLIKTKNKPLSDNPEDIEIYNLYYNSELNKSVKIIKNPYTKQISMNNVEVKELNTEEKKANQKWD